MTTANLFPGKHLFPPANQSLDVHSISEDIK